MITRVAMTATSTMMRMLRGIWRRSDEIARLEKATTKVRATPMTMAVFNCTVTARAEQMPRICLEMGLLCHKAWEMAWNVLFLAIIPPSGNGSLYVGTRWPPVRNPLKSP